MLHYPLKLAKSEDWTAVLEGRPDTEEDDGEVVCEEDSPWFHPTRIGNTCSTFNCCTFAVGDIVGLTAGDWIAPNASGDTAYTVPMQVILDSYFELVRVYREPAANWEIVDKDGQLSTDDVLCYVRSDAQIAHICHAGKIRKENGRNWLVSKFGSGPILRATIESTGMHYSEDFNEIRVYRKKTG